MQARNVQHASMQRASTPLGDRRDLLSGDRLHPSRCSTGVTLCKRWASLSSTSRPGIPPPPPPPPALHRALPEALPHAHPRGAECHSRAHAACVSHTHAHSSIQVHDARVHRRAAIRDPRVPDGADAQAAVRCTPPARNPPLPSRCKASVACCVVHVACCTLARPCPQAPARPPVPQGRAPAPSHATPCAKLILRAHAFPRVP
jgi:hypothetical protein